MAAFGGGADILTPLRLSRELLVWRTNWAGAASQAQAYRKQGGSKGDEGGMQGGKQLVAGWLSAARGVRG